MSNCSNTPARSVTIRQRWRFAIVLVASLLLAVAQPLLSGLLNEQGSFDFFFSLLIGAVLLMVFEDRDHRKVALSLGAASFLGIWTSHGFSGLTGQLLLIAAHLLGICFFGFALYGILRAIFARETSGDAIFGAVCGYLLLGIIWNLLYSAVESTAPGSFQLSASGRNDPLASRLDRSALSYYSFITLTTVGYGDVTPTTPLARTLSWMEALTGQFYLAILVAGLVGFKVTQNTS
jgi:voltage-gated potassium channel